MSLAASPASTGTPTTPSVPLTAARRRVVRGLGVLGSLVAVAAVWTIGSGLGADFVLTDPSGTAVITLVVAVGFALVASLLGWLTLAVLERFAARARTIWTVLASAVLVLSWVPVALEGATGATKVTLAVLHLAVGVVLIPTFAGTARRA